MVSTLDILYIVLAICSLIVTVVLVIFGIELIGAVKDMRRIANNVEHIASMVDRLASIAIPGVELVAKGAQVFERNVGSFLKRKADKISKL